MFGSFFKSLGANSKTIVLHAPLAGRVLPLSSVDDELFSEGLLGDGVAIEPTGTKVVAPADAKVETIFPTGHAIALHTDDGLDLLIHLGLETESLQGRHFDVHVKPGDAVRCGEVLIDFDREAIASEGYDVTVPILICNSAEFSSIKGRVGDEVAELDELAIARAR